MFDKTTLLIAPARPQTSYVHTDVHEHRAPTDESVRLLKELEDKAAEKVKSAVSVNAGLLDAVIHEWRDELSDSVEYRITVKLNRERIEAKIVRRGYENADLPTLSADLQDALAREISRHIVVDALTRALGRRF